MVTLIETPAMDKHEADFVTVVSVSSPKTNGFVTVLTIGDDDPPEDITEEVLVYRLPGERLGFGLKFEGGTKAAEFVKRLFIQSCAPDSPASRVNSSWGQLVEGDEVLEIDSIPVKTMTRIDCVRCLKDSNVVIKLRVKHTTKPTNLPQIVSTEKKRTSPPPPPVPPRKVPRKGFKSTEPPVPPARQECRVTRFQSPRNSGKFGRERRISVEGGPPDPEVYTDLFSPESVCSLSESDDTGSSISTVVDRLGSFPTTTNSSFAGSLPSTPTSLKKTLDLSYFSELDSEDLENNNVPMCGLKNLNEDASPSPPPRVRNQSKVEEFESQIENLPRLVDFVPKSSKAHNCIEIMQDFLEHEKRIASNNFQKIEEWKVTEEGEIWSEKDFSGYQWNVPALATIGEEEEGAQDALGQGNDYKVAPIVIVENADSEKVEVKESCKSESGRSFVSDGAAEPPPREPSSTGESSPTLVCEENPERTSGEVMEGKYPSYCRQPPDGHEFPDVVSKKVSQKGGLKEKLAVFSGNSFGMNTSKVLSRSVMSIDGIESTLSEVPSATLGKGKLSLDSSRADKSQFKHSRSISLIDVSATSDQLAKIVEARKKCFSKLRGLVIPEYVDNPNTVDIPEIKSYTATTELNPLPLPLKKPLNNSSSSLPTTVWKQTPSIQQMPMYSPAFKRKPLQLPKITNEDPKEQPQNITKTADLNIAITASLNDTPKSLESITTPTHFDYSFEYTNKFVQDSDNDSAVSSSQSGCFSSGSTPDSPTSGKDKTKPELRLLKAQSEEAINRKNILALAKCRSGKDFKVEADLVQKKFDEDEIDAGKSVGEEVLETAVKVKDIIVKHEIGVFNRVPKCMTPIKSSSVADLKKSFEKLAQDSPKELPKPEPKPEMKPELKPVLERRKAIVTKTPPESPRQPEKKQGLIVPRPVQRTDTSGVGLKKVVLKPEIEGGSVGITLAGGIDYESKDITIHKIRIGSVAHANGQLQKGDKILTINGRNTKGMTHAESVAALKECVSELIIVAQSRNISLQDSPSISATSVKEKLTPFIEKEAPCKVILMKDGSGLGLSFDGGLDPIRGNVPLVIKKIFKGSVADKSNELNVGDEVIFINDVDVRNMSRFEAWSLMKGLPDGMVTLGTRKSAEK